MGRSSFAECSVIVFRAEVTEMKSTSQDHYGEQP